MGTINLYEEKNHRELVERELNKRGLKPLDLPDWEIHGPHQGMNYVVFVGLAESRDKKIFEWGGYVAIYPQHRAVYEIEDSAKWWDTSRETRLLILK